MHRSSPVSLGFRPSLYLILLTLLLAGLWLAGGASRASVIGQATVRTFSALALISVVLFGDRYSYRRWGAVGWFLIAAIGLALLQLIPLPPTWWQALPGRALFAEAAAASGQPQPWRPWSIVPGATANALASLIVPVTILILVSGLRYDERRWLLPILLVAIGAAMLLGILQFSGARIDNPFVNDTVGEVSGDMANRNHFALFLAFGCALAPVWAFSRATGISGERTSAWRGLAAFGCILLFALTILGTGSRAGILLGLIGLAGGMALVWRSIRRLFRRSPRWVLPTVVAGAVGLIAVIGLASFAADRAASINRAMAIDAGGDIRVQALPTVIEMVRTYFPTGSGLGSFDAMFRLHEPDALLKPTYLNHAHNEYLEIALDAGLPGIALLVAAISWWAVASFRAWRADPDIDRLYARLGSVMLGLTFLASAVDYPVRTPLIMAMTVIAGVWLDGRIRPSPGGSFTRP